MYRLTAMPPVRSQGFPFALDASVRPRDLSVDLEVFHSIPMLLPDFDTHRSSSMYRPLLLIVGLQSRGAPVRKPAGAPLF
ncbi:MAG: hypothetical protein BJ554DRAFT_7296 [Olpidium bornovanus]|uniref:Uncharacterized protein n=1 Tax=Olpidium bornovanus TaxID=278681 RepID=A0A8H8DJ86_9FUNG|nr:MAG: hypothetical protein BJ554DRAFT_7296 [Olpidium bornovanus]